MIHLMEIFSKNATHVETDMTHALATINFFSSLVNTKDKTIASPVLFTKYCIESLFYLNKGKK